jgi:hypothetical protein
MAIPHLFTDFEIEYKIDTKSCVFDTQKMMLRFKYSSSEMTALHEKVAAFAKDYGLNYKPKTWANVHINAGATKEKEAVEWIRENLIEDVFLTMICIPELHTNAQKEVSLKFQCQSTAFSKFPGIYKNKIPQCMGV